MTQLGEIRRSLPATVRVVELVFESRTRDPDAWVTLDPSDPDSATVATAADWHSRPDLVSVAVLRGRVSGLALRVALGCDLRVAAADTVLVIDAPTGPEHLVHLDVARVHALAPRLATRLVLAGGELDADTAAAAGLLDVVVHGATLMAAADELADRLVATDRDVSGETKALLRAAQTGRAGLGAAQQAAVHRLTSPAAAERAG